MVAKVALGQLFSEYFCLLRQFSFYRMLHTYLSSGAGTTGQLLAGVPSGPSLIQSQELHTQKKTELRHGDDKN
jgi:hypothetical protein